MTIHLVQTTLVGMEVEESVKIKDDDLWLSTNQPLFAKASF